MLLRQIVNAAQKPPANILWPVWTAIGFPVLLVVLNATPIAPNIAFVLIGIPALLCIWACLGIWALIISIRSICRRQWSRALVSALLPLVILMTDIQLLRFIHFSNDCGDLLSFIFLQPAYLEQIHATPQNGEPRLLVFNRGGMIWASRGYVYDESDEVTRPESSRSAGWKARADQTELSCGYYAKPFPGDVSFTRHWYLASFDC